MERLVDWAAPRSTGDLVAKAAAFLVLINLLNFVITVARGSTYAIGDGLGHTSLVALPFILFNLVVLRRQRELQVRLVVLATTDLMTGLPNRRDFLVHTRMAVAGGPAP